MIKPSDGIPEPIVGNERSKRVTAEFCNAEHGGYRCMLPNGHAGTHECIAYEGVARWPPSRAS